MRTKIHHLQLNILGFDKINFIIIIILLRLLFSDDALKSPLPIFNQSYTIIVYDRRLPKVYALSPDRKHHTYVCLLK